jgi:hypothetical protein
MKKIVALLMLTLGFAAHAETNDYKFTPQCQIGEIGYVNVKSNLDGSMVLHPGCLPANCLVRNADEGVYTVDLTPATRSVPNDNHGVIVYSLKNIAKIPASSKSQAKAEVQKLIQQGYCHKASYHSIWDDL